MIIVDSHCHLDMLDADLDQIVQTAAENHVKFLQTICVKLENFDKILAIAHKYDNVFASVGVHPNEVRRDDITSTEQLLELSSNSKVIGLGETGLDYYRTEDKNNRTAQIESFSNHIQASQSSNLPVIIHTRDAEHDTADVVAYHMKEQQFPALIHCFTASKEFARKMLNLGLYISISGIVTFKNAEELRDIVRYVPAERLLVETDSPYLAPTPYRGKTNQPAYTLHVLEQVAQLKNVTPEKMAEITTNNFLALFQKAKI